MIQKSLPPLKSLLQPDLARAYFYDCHEAEVNTSGKSALEIYLHSFNRAPALIDFLMTARNQIVRLFGLKDLGRFTDIDGSRSVASYKVGDKVGIFSILSLSDTEVVLHDDDKHLQAKVSFYKYPDEERRVAVTTVVHVKNLPGKIYLFFVLPVHKIIAPLMVRRLAASNRKV